MRYTNSYQAPLGFSLTPWVKRLLIANTVVFLITTVSPEFFFRWFAFTPSEILVRPWGLITYMFLHADFWHLFFNMLILFFFGPPLESRWGSREFVKYYFLCGLGGVALSFLFASYGIVGASAAMYGIMLAFALYWPNAPIYIWGILPVKAKWMVAFLFVVSFTSAVGGSGGGVAHLAHLGGLLTGFLYLRSDWRPGQARRTKEREVRIRRLAIVPRDDDARQKAPPPPAAEKWSQGEESVLDEVDRILDKISAQGMGSLTSEERQVLDEVSRRHRSN